MLSTVLMPFVPGNWYMPMPTLGIPFINDSSLYVYAPSSILATSLRRTVLPSGVYLMMMFSNSSGVERRPCVLMISSCATSGLAKGGWLSLPAATCLFWFAQGVYDLRSVHVEVRKPVRIEPDAHAVFALAEYGLRR